MDCSFIIQQGAEGKYRITFSGENYHADRDDFKVILSWGFRRQTLTIEKSEMELDSDGNYFFVFDTSEMLGKVMVTCLYSMEDSDQTDGIFACTDRQVLCFVTTNPLPKLLCVPSSQCGHWVSYERLLSPDEQVAYQYLTDADREYVTTSDGEYLAVNR